MKTITKKLLSASECNNAEVSIVLTGDTEIRGLNKQYRNKDAATDVLSFPQQEGERLEGEGVELLGDVVISLETAERQAAELGAPLQDEVARLLIHGLLHLLGYDHENVPEKEARRMERKEEELWELVAGLL